MHDKINREQNVARVENGIEREGAELCCRHVQSIKVASGGEGEFYSDFKST